MAIRGVLDAYPNAQAKEGLKDSEKARAYSICTFQNVPTGTIVPISRRQTLLSCNLLRDFHSSGWQHVEQICDANLYFVLDKDSEERTDHEEEDAEGVQSEIKESWPICLCGENNDDSEVRKLMTTSTIHASQ